MSNLDEADIRYLRRAIELSRIARDKGNGAYGAVLVGADGQVLAEAENNQVTDRDPTGHAETNLVRIAAKRFDARTLAGATLYASAEPCAMCAGAVFWSGVKRVVYALGSERNYALLPPSGDELRIGCREILGRAGRAVEVVGPALEDEAARVFTG
ncbi:nucleoside deaminase [Thauera sp. 2A1]|uniref:nucleoside deaminase n=1 Tax=Thauera sp. 2A1 TaxID=2570191 RepID=UPI001291ECA3|nr:nucleoside deaminase [Thauera sp. 2A1]KAI5914703.1 nucleoside deaminase [Thauera sp. 2A1]